MPLPQPPGARRSVALVITLAILTIVSTMLIGFVLSTRQDRGATQSYSDSLRADQLALGGLDTVVASLRAEAAAPGLSSNFPSGGFTNAVPYGVTNAVSQLTVGTNALYPLLKVSGGTSFITNGAFITNVPSTAALSTAASLNNRKISLTRWNKPQLVPSTATAQFPAPKWIVVGRKGPFAPSNANPNTAGATPGLNSANEVLGRFAYAVYDLSGLLDINVAGLPGGAAGPKGLMPWADLSQVGSVSAFTAIPTKRNAGSAASFSVYVTNTWAPGGFLGITNGDTAFLSRQELINYALSNNFTAALPYLTVFSRELNGPTWKPTTNMGAPYAYTNNQYTLTSTNPFIMLPRVGAGFPRVYTTNGPTLIQARVGEPLVKYRFPLDKIPRLIAGDTTVRKALFGLDDNGSNGLYRNWIYTNPKGTATGATPHIFTLNEVQAENREPDFFELLKAGILSGSLGKTGRGDTLAAGVTDPDSVSDYQIFRIGLNIIDQVSSDPYPSTLVFNGNEFYGVKSLPYISQAFVTCVPDAAASSTNACIYFNLWNPLQTGSTNMNLRLVPLGSGASSTYNIQYANTATAPYTPWTSGGAPGTITALTFGYFDIAFNPTTQSYASETPLTGAANSGPLATPLGTTNAFQIPVPVPTAADASGGTAWNTAVNWTMLLSTTNMSFALQFQDPNSATTYHTYNVFSGLATNAVGATTFAVSAGITAVNLPMNNTAMAALANSSFFTKADPRTSRWSVSWNTNTPATSSLYSATSLSPLGKGTPYILTNLASASASYPDADAVVRKTDYTLGGNPYANLSDRPIILQRPYASVGELGYAFRDMPWKSLDFFTKESADSALLDLFTVTGGTIRRTASGDEWIAAGRVSPNSPLPTVLAAMLSGPAGNPAIFAQTTLTNLTFTNAFTSRANLVNQMMNSANAGGANGANSTSKATREGLIRALAESSNTRTWNFLVDVVAQTGHYPPTATTFDQFVVTGERRYWLHVAIDRYTGEIVDQQLEAVSE